MNMKKYINLLFISIAKPTLYIYERWFMYRIRAAWGEIHLNRISKKGKNVRIVGYSRFFKSGEFNLG